jgi:multicomponent Na+:H+ antiporter subunit D
MGLAALYSLTGTVNLADAAVKLQSVQPETRGALQAVLLAAFGVKAAIFPVSAWLPDSYPTAPAPVTAVFAGLLTKVGVYAMVRVQTLLFPDSPRSELFLVLGMATMLVGILGAISQRDIKRILSFTLVSHVGFVLVGLGLFTRNGLAGGLFYVVHHITTQTSLFLLAGLIEYRAGTTDVDRLGGLARLAPVLAGAFLVQAMSLGGIPPSSGFLGKLAVLQAGVQEGTGLALASVGVGLLTSLLTLYALAKVWSQAFWRPSPLPDAAGDGVRAPADDVSGTLLGYAGPGDRSRLPRALTVPAYALVMVGLAFTVAAGPLYGYAERSADELRSPASYVARVLGGAE